MDIRVYDLVKSQTIVKLKCAKHFMWNVSSKIDTSENAVSLIRDLFNPDEMAEERMWIVAVDTKLRPKAVFELSHGGYDTTLTHGPNIFVRVLLSGCQRFILLHNHPSGDVMPSNIDMDFDTRIKECCNILGLDLLDNIILGEDGFYYTIGGKKIKRVE